MALLDRSRFALAGIRVGVGAWAHLFRRLWRNREFLRDLFSFLVIEDDTRHAVLGKIIGRLYRRAMERDGALWRGSAKGIAKAILEVDSVGVQLKSTPHLGVLQDSSSTVNRWNYTLLTIHILYSFKKEFAGYDLGGTGAKECRLPSGKKASLLEVAQSWSILLNLGHLFGTFATERALLFELLGNRDARESFLGSIHENLRSHAAAVLDSHRLNEFHYALACWRISRMEMDPELRSNCIALLEAFFERREEAELGDAAVHLWAFRSARQLAYNRLHVYMGVGHPMDAVKDAKTIRALSPWVNLAFEPKLAGESSILAGMLAQVDAYQLESFFSSSEAASQVIAHVHAFRAWWQPRANEIPVAIDQLFGRQPSDWRDAEEKQTRHFSRFLLPSARSWHRESERWFATEASAGRGNVLLTPRDRGDELICDLYVDDVSAPDPLFLHHVAKEVARHCELSWQGNANPSRRELWRSIADFGLRLFSLVATPGHRPLLRPARTLRDGPNVQVGYAQLCGSRGSGLERARVLASNVKSRIRSRELNAATLVAEETATLFPECPILLFLGSVELLWGDSQKPAAEFDGLWAFFTKTGITWYVLEHKKSSGALSQLSRSLSKFQFPAEIYQVERADISGDVAVFRIDWIPNRSQLDRT